MKLRMSKSQWIAVILLCALATWMASGMIDRHNVAKSPEPALPKAAAERELTDVQVTQMQAKQVTRYVQLQGQSEAERIATVRVETGGRIVKLPGKRGKRVKREDEIAVLAMNDRQARLNEAQALVEQRKSEFDAAQTLGERGFQAEKQIRQARASLAAAEARLAAIKEEIKNVRILAPFDGVLEARPIELGDYVSVGDEIAKVVDDDPLRIVAHVPQHKVNRIKVGIKVEITFITGEKTDGVVSLVSSVAEEGTRTFRVEVEMQNEQRSFRAGMSATVEIPTGTVKAQRVSPALFSLDTEGRLGIKTVDADNKVVFHTVNVIRATTGGVWVAGLPDSARVITVGQGFVRPGETVRPVPADATDTGGTATSLQGPEADIATTKTSG